MKNNDKDYDDFSGLYSDISQEKTYSNQSSISSDIESIPISDYQYHYLCNKCHLFPLIEFCKDKKYIKYTCSCFNNKKILIRDLIDNIYNSSIVYQTSTI